MESVSVWRSPKVDVRESHLGGRAVFANASIAKDEPVAIKVGHVVGFDEVQRLTQEIGDFSLQIAEGLFLSPRSADEYDAMVVHINHSCDANVGFEGNVAYVAVRDIDAGEELCHDYAMARVEPYSLYCLCGTAACRGTVRETDWQRADVQARYAGYFMPHVQRRIERV
ncbi:MAG: SET domain-containing protein-lysine N-methyltransferase [Acidimicrobiales bacterium]|nr:SET domain-containing protein-lysine N-methyltransferase [Acidimicrobiales bacterium]